MNNLCEVEKLFGDLSRWAKAPDYWISTPDNAACFIKTLTKANIRIIGKSAGGRGIIAVEYGAKEPVEAAMDNLQSALAALGGQTRPTEIFPEVFFGKRRREKPVVVLQGALHGGEITGTAAALNLCNVIETGKDLRGKEWPILRELASQVRLLIIPWLNPDGTSRWPLAHCEGVPHDLYQCLTQGIMVDGTRLEYPQCKNICPVPVDKMAFLGSYYNDSGVNLQHDFCAVDRQPETSAWMRYYLDERPDGVIIMHCDHGSMLSSPAYYIPEGFKLATARLGACIHTRLKKAGFNIRRGSMGNVPNYGVPALDQYSAVYQACGALPALVEFPAGTDIRPFTCGQLLDIGLTTFEEILYFALHEGFRPYESWDEIKR